MSERKRKEKNPNKWEAKCAIMEDVVLSKSLSAELLCGEKYMLKIFLRGIFKKEYQRKIGFKS